MQLLNLIMVLPIIYTYTLQDLQTTVVTQCRKLACNTRAAAAVVRTKGCEYTRKYGSMAVKKAGCCLNTLRKKIVMGYLSIYNKLRGRPNTIVEENEPEEDHKFPEEMFDINEFMKMLEELQKQSKFNMGNETESGYETGENEEYDEEDDETDYEEEKMNFEAPAVEVGEDRQEL